jgi:hypothetical protein
MGVHKFRRSPNQAHQALGALLDMREDTDFAQGDPQAIEDAATAAFEAEVAMQALAGKGSLPRRVRAELHQLTEARRDRHMAHFPSLVGAGLVEVS